MDTHDFADKVVLVTGGSRGIGKAIVLEAVARGARVAFCARRAGEAAEQVLAETEQLAGPGRVVAAKADVSCEDDVESFFERALEAFGQVDVVVNNAGFYNVEGGASASGLMLQIPTAEWDHILSTNLTGAFLVSRRGVKQFLAQGTGGTIISIGSVSQDGGTGLVSYAVSKAGLLGLTESIARDYGPQGVRAHVMVVGFLRTDLNKATPDKYLQQLIDWGPQKRAGSVEEIASVVLFLASSHSTLFNAAPVYVSGGARELPAYLVKIN